MTTLLDALSAIERGDPYAMRKAVDAMGVAIDHLSASDAKATSNTTKKTARSKR